MRYLLPSVIGVGLVALALAGSLVGPSQSLSEEELALLTGTDWYALLIGGERSGYARVEVAPAEVNGAPGLRVTEDVHILIRIRDQQLQAGKFQVTLFDGRLRPVRIEMVKDELGRASSLQATLEGDQLTITRSAGGGANGDDKAGTTRTLTVAPDFGSDMMLAWRAARGELHIGDRLSYQTYDPELDALDQYQVTVDRTEQVDGVETLVVTAFSNQLKVAVVNWLDRRGGLVRQHVPGLMDLTLQRVSEEEAQATISPFELSTQVPVVGHLPARDLIESLQLRVRRRTGAAVELIPNTRRQQVTAAGDDAIVTITRQHPPASTLALPVDVPELAPFTQPTTHAQSDDPDIVATARVVVGEERDAWVAAQRIVDWVHRNMHKVQSEPRPITAVECLRSMTGDCTEHAVLTVALARAVGLPARMVVGLVYTGGAFGYHAWNEIYVGEWVEMDPSWGQMTADAGHLLLQSSDLDDLSYAQASLATGRTLGTIAIDLLSYLRTDGQRVQLTPEG